MSPRISVRPSPGAIMPLRLLGFLLPTPLPVSLPFHTQALLSTNNLLQIDTSLPYFLFADFASLFLNGRTKSAFDPGCQDFFSPIFG